MKRTKNQFVTSDWHIGHANAIKFDNRPFKDLDDMHRVLINNYNASVRPGDICYFLGDIGVKDAETTKSVISKLNGTKVLISGNHDKGDYVMMDCGFDIVINAAKVVIAKEIVTMSHCPLPGLFREHTEGMRGTALGENWHGESRPHYNMYTVPNEGQFHLHGHIHSPNGGKSQKILDKQMDVGVPSNKYRPVSFSEIESWIVKYKRDVK